MFTDLHQKSIRQNKFDLTKDLVANKNQFDNYKLLDVGCRDSILKDYLDSIPQIKYTYNGLDLFQNDRNLVNYVCSIEETTPIDDSYYDMVTALDVLEHTNEFTESLEELIRISKSTVVVNLPNMAHIFFRLRFLKNGFLSSKYNLKYKYGLDRHRWLTVLPQTDAYMKEFCTINGYRLTTTYLLSPKKRSKLYLIESLLNRLGFSKSWYTWSIYYIIEKPK